jgi:DNA-directed RNA polymerase subunit RPC12/RpoP
MTSEPKEQLSPDKPAVSDQPSKPAVKPARKRRRWPLALAILAAAILLFLGVPRVIHAFNTISTDDAYVNGYVTFVAPRVSGQVIRDLVCVQCGHRLRMEERPPLLPRLQARVETGLRAVKATL